MSSEEYFEDAQIDGLPQRSWFGGWLRGVLFGLVAFVVGAIVLSLAIPLPDHLPGIGRVQILRDPTPEVAVETPETSTEDQQVTEADPEAPAPSTDTEPAQPQAAADDAATAPTPTETTDEQPSTPATTPDQPDTPALSDAEPDAPATPADQTAQETPAAPEASEDQNQQIAALPADPEPEPEPAAAPVIDLPGPAIDVNARRFEPPEGSALLAVVISDAHNGSITSDALPLMTMPLTFAFGPGKDSRSLAEQARAAGHEVLAQLPMALTPEDTAPGLMVPGQPATDLMAQTNRHLAELDLAIGATVPAKAELLSDTEGMAAVMDPLARHGFIWIDPQQGIGSASKNAADRSETGWAVSDRLIPADADADQIYQNLESAASLARRQGSTIVYITASQDALRALVLWGLNRGGNQVWFAPVSAVVNKRQQQ